MQTFSWISPASSLSSFLFAKFAAVVVLKKILNDDQWKESRRMRDVKERTDVCENRQAPGASHRRLNLTDFWFDDRLPRQKFLVRGLEMESHLYELRQNVSSGHERFPRSSSFLAVSSSIFSFLRSSSFLISSVRLSSVSSIFLFYSLDLTTASLTILSSSNSVDDSPRLDSIAVIR